MPIKKTSNTKAGALSSASGKTKSPAFKPVAKPAPKPATKPAFKPAAQPPAKPGKRTTIIAKIDVGWGNSVYLRGQGGGLSWDVGVAMECANDDQWTWTGPASAGAITFKFVRNDLHWELGEDHTVPAGGTVLATPDFPPWD